MRRRAIRKLSEPAKKVELPRPKTGVFHEASPSRQNRQQTQQQHLIKRVDHLAPLPRVRQRPEMIQKNNRFTQSARRVHRATPLPSQRRPMDSELYSVVTHSFTRLPWTFAPLRLTPVMMAPWQSAPDMLTSDMSAPDRLARASRASSKLAPVRTDFSTLVPDERRSSRAPPRRSASGRMAPFRRAPRRCAPRMSAR